MILFTILPLVNAQLIADYTGDVIHFYFEDDTLIIEIDDRPNVDITEIGYEIVENQLFIKMCVVGEIILENNFSYVVTFGPHLLGYYYGQIHNSSTFIEYDIDDNFIICIFEIGENENISEYELIGVALEVNALGNWFDMVPDLYPPYILFGLGAGQHIMQFGRGICLKVNNIHHSESIDCTFEVYCEGVFGLVKSNISYGCTVEPDSSWELHLVGWRAKPAVCKVNVSLTISDYTFTLSGISIGQWYFFNNLYRYPAQEPYDIS
jgi:hypothetical protein